jgi:hypothetical protein
MTANDNNIAGAICGNVMSFFGIAMSTTYLSQIISIVCTVIGTIITIISALVIPIWKSIRKAKEDGRIDPDEVQDIIDVTKEGLDKIQGDKKDVSKK